MALRNSTTLCKATTREFSQQVPSSFAMPTYLATGTSVGRKLSASRSGPLFANTSCQEMPLCEALKYSAAADEYCHAMLLTYRHPHKRSHSCYGCKDDRSTGPLFQSRHSVLAAETDEGLTPRVSM